ncbi:Y+L amino acid transporter 2 [Dermatophagoides farinae]|uniref:Large neutral amino acids transporter-like protein n=1 Tax=Dermatophagoides farinae TaxID=6954 RepID=A0A922IEN8_DERFA|nr:Y+L amino acid transporter 2-like [Dermatophagoides farinae]KAH7636579.1 large neutral amino acids transporter-like protein [Dermatophagoides farinae]KAH9528675.1 Y+L amino acid transporter 2 [Dermatophagoides farinae]
MTIILLSESNDHHQTPSYGTMDFHSDSSLARKRTIINDDDDSFDMQNNNIQRKKNGGSFMNNSNNNDSPFSSSSKNEQIALKKELGLMNGVAIIVGIIVGSGIFVSPRGVLQEAGSVGFSLIVWILCGVLSTIGALCYAELGTSIPESGGDYVYIQKAFGPLPSFLFLWVSILIIQPAGNAIAAMTFANYILQSIYPTCSPPANAVRLIAAIVIVLLIFINCFNVKWSTRVQDSFTFAKIIALLIIIGCGVMQFFNKDNANQIDQTLSYPNSFENTSTSPGHIALAFYSGLFSYAGWNYLNFVVEELRDPFRNLPRAIYISVPLVTLIYLLANIAYFTVLTPEEILTSNAVAVTFGDRILGSFAWIMPLSVALSTFGGLNGGIFASSRLFFVGARRGHLPDSLAMINVKYFTPMPSLVFLGLLSVLYLTTTQVYVLINYATFVESSSILASIGALLYLRYHEPERERPIKVHLALPILFFVICLFLVLLPFYVSPMEAGMGIIITLTGIPVYMLTIYWKSKPRTYNRFINGITIFIQKLFYCVSED